MFSRFNQEMGFRLGKLLGHKKESSWLFEWSAEKRVLALEVGVDVVWLSGH